MKMPWSDIENNSLRNLAKFEVILVFATGTLAVLEFWNMFAAFALLSVITPLWAIVFLLAVESPDLLQVIRDETKAQCRGSDNS